MGLRQWSPVRSSPRFRKRLVSSLSPPSAYRLGQLVKLACIYVPKTICNLFRTGDLQSLALLDGLHKRACLEQRIVRARIEPGHTPAKYLHFQTAGFKIELV